MGCGSTAGLAAGRGKGDRGKEKDDWDREGSEMSGVGSVGWWVGQWVGKSGRVGSVGRWVGSVGRWVGPSVAVGRWVGGSVLCVFFKI